LERVRLDLKLSEDIVSWVPIHFETNSILVFDRVIRYPYDKWTAARRSTGSLGARALTPPSVDCRPMSEHGERLRDLSERLAAAKEFL